ncbi:MAG: class I SAM-dependent methyltransferase [Myxococcota bacterium]
MTRTGGRGHFSGGTERYARLETLDAFGTVPRPSEMKWYLKALVQNGIACLPSPLADPLYFQLQRRMGELRRPRFDIRFQAALEIAASLATGTRSVADRDVLEVGTGRTVDLPLGLWLLGARSITTVDITRLLRVDLVDEALDHLSRHWPSLRPQFLEHAPADLVDERFAVLEAARGLRSEHDLDGLLERTAIRYRAPADAAALPLREGTIDLVVTFVVLQHVPPDPMVAILREGRRLLREDGEMVHIANTSDHFSHADPALSPLHFLRYSARQWDLIAGNRFMYQNRLRADDYYHYFASAGLKVAHRSELTDARALRDLEAGLPIHADFRGRPAERDAVIRFTARLVRDDAPPPVGPDDNDVDEVPT